MTPSFPLLSLPDLGFDTVHGHFEIQELILLSQCSKRMKGIVKSMVSSRKGTQIVVEVDERLAKVAVRFANHKRFQWSLKAERDSQVDEAIVSGPLGVPSWKVSKKDGRWKSRCQEVSFEETTLSIVRMIRSIFNHQLSLVSLCIGDNTDFEKLLITSDTIHSAKKVVVYQCALSESEMTFMLDAFTGEKLTMSANAGRHFSYRKTLKFPKIKFPTATWIDLEMLKKMSATSRRITLKCANQISNGNLNEFLKEWMASGGRNLETIKIFRGQPDWSTTPHASDPFRYGEILEGMPTMPGAKKRDDVAEYFKQGYGYQKGRDMRRSDGVWATVLTGNDFPDGFLFTVWYAEDPNAKSK